MILPDNCENCIYGYTVKCKSGNEYIVCDMPKQECQEEKNEVKKNEDNDRN